MKLATEIKKSKKILQYFSIRIIGDGIFYMIPLIIANIITPESFGKFSLAQMIAMIIIAIVITSSQTPFIVHAGKEINTHNKANKTFTIQLFFLISSLIISTLVILIFKNHIAQFTGIDPQSLHWILGLIYGISIKNFFNNLFLSLDKKNTSALFSLILGIITISSITTLHQIQSISLLSIFTSYFIAGIATGMIFIFKIPFKKILPLTLDKKLLSTILKWTSWQVFGLLSVQLVNWGDNIVLRNFSNFKEIGIYNAGYQLFKACAGASLIINTYFLPFISKNAHNNAAIQNYLSHKRPRIFGVAIIGVALLSVLAPQIFSLIFQNTYQGAETIFQVLMIGLVFYIWLAFYLPILNCKEKYRFIQISNIIHVALNLALDYLLIKKYGTIGAAIATSTSYAIHAAIVTIYFRKTIKT